MLDEKMGKGKTDVLTIQSERKCSRFDLRTPPIPTAREGVSDLGERTSQQKETEVFLYSVSTAK